MRVASKHVWIGIDGGATSVKAHVVAPVDGGRLTTVGEGVEHASGEARGFVPIPMERQVAEADTGRLDLSGAERAAGARRVECYAHAVAGLADGLECRRVSLALCAAGRTDTDGRGLLVVRNGPRQPHLLDDLGLALRARGLEWVAVPECIESDGTAAAWGEQFGEGGAFAGVADAYAVGCGTGVAESLKLAGRLCEAHDFPAPWEPPWRGAGGEPCAEESIAMPALGRRWLATRDVRATAADFPEAAARAGEAAATGVLHDFAAALGDFIVDRFTTLAKRGHLLQRVVLAQRAAGLFVDDELAGCFRDPLRARVAAGLQSVPGARGPGGGLERSPEFLVASRLRSAPALGAVARALHRPALVT